MKKFILILSLLSMLTACGPSPEQQSTMTATALTATAAAWTPTPTATHTPTASPTPSPTRTPTPTITLNPDRFYSSDGLFSIIPPEGWISSDIGLKYPMFVGPTVDNINQNLVFITENNGFPMAMYAAFVQDNIQERIKAVESITEEFFTTTTGLEYFRWVIENIQQGTRVRQVLYIMENGDLKLTIIYTRQPGEAPEQDALIDDVIDTFKFEP